MLPKMLLLWGAMTALVFSGTVKWDFDNIEVGKTPPNFKAERTAQESSPAVWEVIEDETAPSGKKVLSLTDWGSTTTKDYTLFWTDSIKCTNLEITFKCKNTRGDNNNSGACWRVKDKDNYYCARASSDEGNFNLYYVSGGVRQWLTQEYMKVPSKEWRTIKIVQKGSRTILSLNGVEKIDWTDTTITGPGGFGMWTKGQGIISFDDFTVTYDTTPPDLQIGLKRLPLLSRGAYVFIESSEILDKLSGKFTQDDKSTDLEVIKMNSPSLTYSCFIKSIEPGAFKLSFSAKDIEGNQSEKTKNIGE